MKLYAPRYYAFFQCIADRCRHSCCIGWEIDVDPETLAKYRTVSGEMGRRLKDGLQLDGESPCFRLTADERCPFLNDRGLCDVILNLGEEYLSQICADHPRFRNFFSDRTEVGLGLCCEAAGQLILSQTGDFQMVLLHDDGEDISPSADELRLRALRDHLLKLAQSRSLPLDGRMDAILQSVGVTLPKRSFAEWTDLYLGLEQLDPAWSGLLRSAAQAPETDCAQEAVFENLLVYFLYRHASAAQDFCEFAAFAAFAVHAARFVRQLCRSKTNCSFEDVVEIARLYSSEIEYSDENIGVLLGQLVPNLW